MVKSGSKFIGAAGFALARSRLGQDSKFFFVFKIFSLQSDHILPGDFIRGFIDIDHANPRFSALRVEEIGEI
jgi:hypothetical protein